MADHQDRRAPLGAQIAHQLDDFRLHGHVERGGRLVGDQEVRTACERDGDHHALTHAAGQLVRVIVHAPLRRGDADARQRLDRELVGFPPALALVQHEHLGDLPAHRRDRVQRRHRLLEDHGDAIAAQLPLLGRGKVLDLPALKPDGAAADPQRLPQQADQGERRDALAAAGFADQAECLAAIDAE